MGLGHALAVGVGDSRGVRVERKAALTSGRLFGVRLGEKSLIAVVGFAGDPEVELALFVEVGEVVASVEVASKLSVRSDNVSLVAKIENIDNVGVFGAVAGRALHAGIVNELPLAVEVVPFLLDSVDDDEALVCRPHVGWLFFDH